MPALHVTGYATILQFGDRPSQIIQLYEDNHQIGSITMTDPALFTATIDMLRHEGPNPTWDENNKRLLFGVEPVAEDET